VDCAISDDAFEAACAIEIGVAQATVGVVADEHVAELRRHMEATDELIADGHFTDVPRYVEANMAFHEYMVGLAGSSSLLAAYRRLSIPTIMARLFSHHDVADKQLIRDHRELVEAYEMENISAARRVIRGHSERARATNNAAIEAGGGRI
jgi:DNA-binding GntR family transcriptional regulator